MGVERRYALPVAAARQNEINENQTMAATTTCGGVFGGTVIPFSLSVVQLVSETAGPFPGKSRTMP